MIYRYSLVLIFFVSFAQKLFSQNNGNPIWKEVSGRSSYLIPNSLDIEDEKNLNIKKKLYVKAVLDAVKNGERFSSNKIINSKQYHDLLTNIDLDEDDFIYTALSAQGIEWQRQESASYTKKENNKWICSVKGLVRKAKKEEIPLTIVPAKIVPESPPIVSPKALPKQKIPAPVVATKPKTNNVAPKKDNKSKNYGFGLYVGIDYITSYIKGKGLAERLNLSSDWKISSTPKVYTFGILIPTKKNFRIGIAYQRILIKTSKDNYLQDDYQPFNSCSCYRFSRSNFTTQYNNNISLNGVYLNFGTLRNAINPNIGFGYARGSYQQENSKQRSFFSTDSTLYLVDSYSTNIGLDFGRKGFKIGINGGLNWMFATDSNDKNLSYSLKDFRSNFNVSLGVNLKLLF